MASNASLRPLLAATRPSARRTAQFAPSAVPAASATSTAHARQFSTTPVQEPKPSPDPVDVPRWKQTPKAMAAPVRLRPINPKNLWKVVEDPVALDEMYKRMLGPSGNKLLPEEVKWLAVTHKSFDHGRRGHNDRLAFLGRRIVELQASLALLNVSSKKQHTNLPDAFDRRPFEHEALRGVHNVSEGVKSYYVSKQKLANIAAGLGVDRVLRWKPKKAGNLEGSGLDAVLATTMYAIVGAVALHRGGDHANKLVKEQILIDFRR
ncbi:ribonuclease-III-like-domain-containing protein [Phyllosticta capitalensis]|uniref:Ribonuclease-III-like-domain-containing protein n=1 Tax=Phyllosticta capitalensis TaxID=121624 RepID=A0ABR1YHF2_9PEZI